MENINNVQEIEEVETVEEANSGWTAMDYVETGVELGVLGLAGWKLFDLGKKGYNKYVAPKIADRKAKKQNKDSKSEDAGE